MADFLGGPTDSLFPSLDPELDFLPPHNLSTHPQHHPAPPSTLQTQLEDAVEILRRQKEQALRDLDALHHAKREALADPEAFVARLRYNSLPKFPGRQVVFPVPSAEEPAAAETIPQRKRRADGVATSMRKSASGSRLRESDKGSVRPSPARSSLSSFAPPSGNDASKPALAASTDKLIASPPTEEEQRRHNSTGYVISAVEKLRARPAPQDDKRQWTPVDQQRLEQLLVDFPDEPVSSMRWMKIANALGNRTPKQVANRVQQYFVRLTLQNKPLPGGGKPPNMELYLNKRKKDRSNDMKSRRRQLPIGDVFVAPTVFMSDEESLGDEPDLADLDEEFKNTEEYRELVRLRKLQSERKHEAVVTVVHYDFRCDCCGMDPIVGPRYRCQDCPQDDELDLCEACLPVDFETGHHNKLHRFERISDAKESDVSQYRDDDYSWAVDASQYQMQYLNPNFLMS